MLVVHPHCVSGGGGGSAALSLASPAYFGPTSSTRTARTLLSQDDDGSDPYRAVLAATKEGQLDGPALTSSPLDVASSARTSGTGVMFARYDRKSFLAHRQERGGRPLGPDFRGLYHNRRVGLVSPPASSTPVKMQLDKFPIWGQLRRSSTDVRLSLPSKREIDRAKDQIVFFAHRRGYTRQEGTLTTPRLPQEDTGERSDPQPLQVERTAAPGSPSKRFSGAKSARGASPTERKGKPGSNEKRCMSSAKSTKSAPGELPKLNVAHQTDGGGPPPSSSSLGEMVANPSERVCRLRAGFVPEVIFSADGQIESGLYPATFRQAPGAVETERRRNIFNRPKAQIGWNPTTKPVNYGSLFLPHVTCPPKSIGIRYRTEIDLVKAGKLTPGAD